MPPEVAAPIDPVARELAAIEEARKAVAARTAAAVSAREAAANDPAVKLADARSALAREKEAADVAEHEVKMDAVYREAVARYGWDGVMRIATRAGSLLLRVQSEAEADIMIQRRDGHRRGMGPTPAEQALAEANADRVMWEGLRMTALHPPGPTGQADTTHFDRTVERYHGVKGDCWVARNQLISGRVLAEGKGVAP